MQRFRYEQNLVIERRSRGIPQVSSLFTRRQDFAISRLRLSRSRGGLSVWRVSFNRCTKNLLIVDCVCVCVCHVPVGIEYEYPNKSAPRGHAVIIVRWIIAILIIYVSPCDSMRPNLVSLNQTPSLPSCFGSRMSAQA